MQNNSSDQYRALFNDIKAGKTDKLSTHYANGGKGVQKNGQTLLMCAIDAGNQAAINMILKTPAGQWGLKNLVDKQGNTALHYAVAARNLTLAQYLTLKEGVDPQIANHNGEKPADWLQQYQINLHIQQDELPQKIATGDLSAITALLKMGGSVTLPYNGGNTALHLAIIHNQTEIVRELLKYSDSTALTKKNFAGQTPVELAQNIQPAEHSEGNTIRQLLLDAENGNFPSGRVQLPTLLEIDSQKVTELSRLIVQGVSENSLSTLESYLPTLVTLAQIACQKSIQILNMLRTTDGHLSELYPSYNKLLTKLFGEDYNRRDLAELERKASNVAHYLNEIQKGHHKIVLEYKSGVLGQASKYTYKTVSLDIGAGTLEKLVWTLIHESSHQANGNLDFCYTSGEDLQNLQRLATQGVLQYPDSTGYYTQDIVRILSTQALLSGNFHREKLPELNTLLNEYEQFYLQKDSLNTQLAELKEKSDQLFEQFEAQEKKLYAQSDKSDSEINIEIEEITEEHDAAQEVLKNKIKDVESKIYGDYESDINVLIIKETRKLQPLNNTDTISSVITYMPAIESGSLYFDQQDQLVRSKAFLYSPPQSQLNSSESELLDTADNQRQTSTMNSNQDGEIATLKHSMAAMVTDNKTVISGNQIGDNMSGSPLFSGITHKTLT
ncbi:ankyrin repeat domain-containing protein [Candidatus Fukatsuia endosymbiont of Tuberolachnus salignus]|uniref:ankyrin repeat domain-containing protein n=1 Tax=Candidatus Fukatsuia endosymbiont of Tuberolachnus salignus TaxID=3077957 RepID=UPI00313B031E